MTVSQLMTQLMDLPADMPVVVSDPEGSGGHTATAWQVRVIETGPSTYVPNVRAPNDGVRALWIE